MKKSEEIVQHVNRIESFVYKDELYSGIDIITSKQTLRFYITAQEQCCEEYGVDLLINGEVVDIEELDTRGLDPLKGYVLQRHSIKPTFYSTVNYDRHFEYNVQFVEVGLMFETIEDLMFETIEDVSIIVRCEHNGDYPHEYLIEWEGFQDRGTL